MQTELSIVRPGEYLSRTGIIVVVSRIGVDGVVQGRIFIILRVPLEAPGKGLFLRIDPKNKYASPFQPPS